MKATMLAESSCYFFYFLPNFSAPAMSTDTSQVGVTLFLSFYNIYHFTFPGILIYSYFKEFFVFDFIFPKLKGTQVLKWYIMNAKGTPGNINKKGC